MGIVLRTLFQLENSNLNFSNYEKQCPPQHHPPSHRPNGNHMNVTTGDKKVTTYHMRDPQGNV